MARSDSSSCFEAENDARQLRRQRGVYYTPAPVARFMVRRSLDPLPAHDPPPRILDPACGAGVFLWEAYQFLKSRRERRQSGRTLSPAERLQIVRQQIFGVDLDPAAIAACHAQFSAEIGTTDSAAEVNAVLQTNIRCGDALRGPDFSVSSSGDVEFYSEAVKDAAVDWRCSFPEAAAAGGFDVVFGNPPYRRECHARDEFERLAQSPLGRRWRQARMDLWYYFLHRGLDLLQPEGSLAFIVPSYWTASDGAGKLIARLAAETTLEELVLLDAAPLFPGVVGRHLIFRLQRGRGLKPCRVIHVPPVRAAEVVRGEFWDALASDASTADSRDAYSVPQGELFQRGQLVVRRPNSLTALLRTCRTLDEDYDVRQGIAENPPTITARVSREFGNQYRTGEGVFVLSAAELAALHLGPEEVRHLRPYFETSALGRYYVPGVAMQRLLYLTRATAATLAACPSIEAHLARFLPILERRRETRKGSCAWWHLHWPREERLFLEPRILSVQMGRVPQFAWATEPTFVGFSVNLILPKPGRPAAPFSLESLTGILNSAVAADWFAHTAKRRGVSLEISGGLLRQFPLPARDEVLDRELAALVRQRQLLATTKPDPQGGLPDGTLDLEVAIERRVGQLYGMART